MTSDPYYGMLDGEDVFLDVLFDDPNDEGARQVYADWLEERGDQRAEWLRFEAAWHESGGAPGESPRIRRERLRQAARLRALCEPAWCWLVTRDSWLVT